MQLKLISKIYMNMAGVMSCGKALEQFTQILLNLYNCRKRYNATLYWLRILLKETERVTFQDEYDYKNKIFPILSSACARTNVILAGKSDSHQHSTTSFSENVMEVKTSYQMLAILSFSDQERALPPSTEISIHVLLFVLKKVQ